MAHVLLQADVASALETLDQAVRYRAAGDSFDLALRLDDDRGSVAAILAQNACRTFPAMDDARLAALDKVGSPHAAIGDNPLLRFATMDLATKATVRDLAALADSLVLRSWTEMRRGVMDYDIIHRSYTIACSKDARVPKPAARSAGDGSILIWAPDEPVERLYIVLTAAAQTGRTVRVIAQPGNLAGISAHVIPVEAAADALARAAVCVIASLSDPSASIGLAAWRIPICATFTSGVQEWISPVCSYRSWSRSSAFSAITQALAAPAPREISSPAQRSAVRPDFNHDARVTIIARSKGAGALREATRRSVEAQTHGNRELLVVDSAKGMRAALAAATGRYILFLDDGDILFSEHLAALVSALENSGGALAYAGALLGYVIDAPGAPTVLGYSVMERSPVSQHTFAALDEFAGTWFRALFRSEPLAQAGLNGDLDGLAVFDAFVRLLGRYDAVHVDRVSAMSLRCLDGSTPGMPAHDYRAEYRKYYEEQPAQFSEVETARAAVLKHLADNAHIALRPPPQRLNPPRPF